MPVKLNKCCPRVKVLAGNKNIPVEASCINQRQRVIIIDELYLR